MPYKRLCGLTLVSLLFAFALGSSADARTWLIHADGTGDAPTIQAGIDSSAVGDTVLVTDGSYADLHPDTLGELTIAELRDGIVLQSQNGPATTILDATSDDIARSVTCLDCGPATRIAGFTITGGDTYFGAGIYVSSGGPHITDNVFRNVYGGTGGGIFVTDGSQALIRGNLFDNCGACCGPGGGIFVQLSDPEIRENQFHNCDAFGGAGVALQLTGARVIDNEFIGNLATDGGALSVYQSDPEVRGNLFTGNSATTSGGAVAYRTGGAGVFENNVVVGNSAAGGGGGMSITDAAPTIRQTTMAYNQALEGGGIHIIGLSEPMFDRVLIALNDGAGEVFCQSPADPTYTCSNVYASAGESFVGDCSDPTGADGNISEDPLFCGEDSVDLQDCSPCVEGYGCGQIGALGIGCACDNTPVQPTSWGRLKEAFRKTRR